MSAKKIYIWSANKHMNRCSMSLVTREIQIKAIKVYHPHPLTYLLSKKEKKNSKHCQGYGEIGALILCKTTTETVWQLLKKLNRIFLWPNNSTPKCTAKGMQGKNSNTYPCRYYLWQQYSQQLNWEQHKSLSLILNVMNIYNKIPVSPKRKLNSDTCYSMGKPSKQSSYA